jgi:flagellar hook-length control protein FliK
VNQEVGQVAQGRPVVVDQPVPAAAPNPREQNVVSPHREGTFGEKCPVLEKIKATAAGQESSAKGPRTKHGQDHAPAQQSLHAAKDDGGVKSNQSKVSGPPNPNPMPGNEEPLPNMSRTNPVEKSAAKAEFLPEISKSPSSNHVTEVQRSEPTKPNQLLPRIFNQVEQGLRQAMVMRPKSITMKLMPEELGELQVHVTIEKEMVQAKIHTESHRVATILKDHQAELEYRMREQGIDLERVDIRDQSRQEERQGKGGQRTMDGHEGFGRHEGRAGNDQGNHPSGSGGLEEKSGEGVREEKGDGVVAGQPVDLTV